MGELNFHGCLILRFYPTLEIHKNLMHAKNVCCTVLLTSLQSRMMAEIGGFSRDTQQWKVAKFCVSETVVFL